MLEELQFEDEVDGGEGEVGAGDFEDGSAANVRANFGVNGGDIFAGEGGSVCRFGNGGGSIRGHPGVNGFHVCYYT